MCGLKPTLQFGRFRPTRLALLCCHKAKGPCGSLRNPVLPITWLDPRREHFQVQLTAVYISVPEGYIAFVEELPGANTQGETLDEVRENLKEAVQLVMEANRELAERSIAGQTNVSREPFEFASP